MITKIKMIDVHTHILPNIDDGARDLAEAIRMIEYLRIQNVTKVICTPHFDPTKTDLKEFIYKRSLAMKLLRNENIDLIAASETVFHEYLFHYPALTALCIEKTKYILLEFPYTEKWDLKVYHLLEKLINYYNVIPIIAHIERYCAIKKSARKVKRLKDMGCVIQLNTSSIIDKKRRIQAIRYLKYGYIDLLGSDCHNMNQRPPVMAEAFDIVIQKLGDKYSDKLKFNAECIVKGINIIH
jgi:protein-tyrosine phosphatase